MTAEEVAKQHNFDFAQYIGEFEGLRIYAGAMHDARAAIGWPQFIIAGAGVDGEDNARLATIEENERLLEAFPEGNLETARDQDTAG